MLSMVLWGCEGISDGLGDAVTWDKNSILINGNRTFILWVCESTFWFFC